MGGSRAFWRKKGISLLFCLSVFLFLSGCSFSVFDIEGMMTPPKATEDQQQISDLMKSEDGTVDFCYPKSGQYRSAMILKDLTGDGGQEALGFSANADGGIVLRFFREREGVWETVASFENTASQVDRVLFGDLNGDGREEIIVGWGAPQAMTASLAVYSFLPEKGEVTEVADPESYGEVLLTDFNGDGVKELFTAGLSAQGEREGKTAPSARVYGMEGAGLTLLWETSLDAGVVKYSGAVFGHLPGGDRAVFLDGQKADGCTVTQIAAVEKNTLGILPPAGEEYRRFIRPPQMQIGCRDIQGDGYVEIPWVRLTAGHTQDTSQPSTAYLVDWMRYDPRTGKAVSVLPTIVSVEENYYVELPRYLKHNIVCFEEEAGGQTFSKIEQGAGDGILRWTELLTIRSFTRSQWQEAQEEFTFLEEGPDGILYGVKIKESGATADALRKGFHLIEE